jgi:tripeptidyl-peptidase-1
MKPSSTIIRVLVLLAVASVGVCIVTAHSVHERQANAARLWKRQPADVDLATTLPLYIALAQENLETSEADLMRVSNPGSPFFAQHWTPAEVVSRFAPANKTLEAVTTWLGASNITKSQLSRSRSGGWLLANVTVRDAQDLLQTRYHLYTAPGGAKTRLACEEYSLPDAIREYVDFIMPTVHLGAAPALTIPPSSRRKSKKLQEEAKDHRQSRTARHFAGSETETNISFPLSTCSEHTTPDCLRAMYGIPRSNTSHPNNTFGIFQTTWSSWLPNDLDAFFGQFSPSLVGKRPAMTPVDGGYWQDSYQVSFFNQEADVDFEYAMSLTAPQVVTNYEVGDQFESGTVNSMLAAFDNTYCGTLNTTLDGSWPDPHPGGYESSDCGTLRPASVISLSYAWDESSFTPAYLRRQCIEFLKLGLQGVSVITSSADCGPAGQAGECLNPTTDDPAASGRFNPTSPATCPYLTVVGGTQLPTNGTVQSREVPFYMKSMPDSSSIYTSGGGFSNVFAVPWYQRNAIAHYLAMEEMALRNISSRFNPNGRGIPDVSAAAANFVVYMDGGLKAVDGTSAAAPVFASVIVKLNDARLNAGKRTVGFLNPTLYANSYVLRDVVEGSNHGCGVEAFPAREGWDPVTGLGTPDYAQLLELYLSLP